ncbi:MAG: DUF1501 domain-containing protein [Bacteroidota bacterium]
MKRRSFIQTSGLASAAMLTPAFLRAGVRPAASSRQGKILVVIQLSGGNDGLNTIIPYGDDIYYSQRPTLSIPPAEVLTLNDYQGLHPALAPLRELYDLGQLAVLNGVGYPEPDRSHFRSMDIWQTGSGSRQNWSTGWLGRYLDHLPRNQHAYHAIEVDDGLSLAMKGAEQRGFAMGDPNRLRRAVRNPLLPESAHAQVHQQHTVSYLYETLTRTSEAADYLYEKSRIYRSRQPYPPGNFGRDLKQVAELITADTDTQVYYLSLTGFDTHARQLGMHQRLLDQYAKGVSAFVKDLKQNRLFEDVIIMTFSEFGRRLAQNGSGGTDHGTANNVTLIGGDLKRAGLLNAPSSLSHLDRGDLIFDVDFRRLYATLLNRWLDAPADQILMNNFEPLDFI